MGSLVDLGMKDEVLVDRVSTLEKRIEWLVLLCGVIIAAWLTSMAAMAIAFAYVTAREDHTGGWWSGAPSHSDSGLSLPSYWQPDRQLTGTIQTQPPATAALHDESFASQISPATRRLNSAKMESLESLGLKTQTSSPEEQNPTESSARQLGMLFTACDHLLDVYPDASDGEYTLFDKNGDPCVCHAACFVLLPHHLIRFVLSSRVSPDTRRIVT
jgi:hypothetical protein